METSVRYHTNQERDCENNRYSNYKDWHRKKDWKDDSKIYIQKVNFFVSIRLFVSVNIAYTYNFYSFKPTILSATTRDGLVDSELINK